MAVQQIPITRGGKDYLEHIGTDADGQSVHYIEEMEPDAETGLKVVWIPDETRIKRKGKGGVASILTIFERTLETPNGYTLQPKEKDRKLARKFTNDQDIKFFIGGFGMPIMMSEGNLLFRSEFGFNDKPVWNPLNGQVIQYTPEQEAEPPTNDYWHVPELPPITPTEPA